LPIALPLAFIIKWRPLQPITPDQKLPLLASLYLVAPLVLWGAAVLEKQSFADYGLPWRVSVLLSMGLGLALGTSGLAVMFAVQRAMGWLRWQLTEPEQFTPEQTPRLNSKPATNSIAILFSTLLLGLWISLTEELIFRGFLINQLQSDYAAWIAAAIASLIFALLHLVWEGRENIPQLPGLWLMGMVLVLARWADGGNLGLAWGLHAGWIWAIAWLDTVQAVRYTGKGPEWLTGFDDKPLAGLVGILFLLSTGGILWIVL
jgi:membrane protease YdiL (CAAX protease family)